MLSPCSGGQQSEVHVSVGTLLPAWAKSESPRRPAPHPLRVHWLPCLVFTPPLPVCVWVRFSSHHEDTGHVESRPTLKTSS